MVLLSRGFQSHNPISNHEVRQLRIQIDGRASRHALGIGETNDAVRLLFFCRPRLPRRIKKALLFKNVAFSL